MDKPVKSVTYGQRDARPTVTSPAAGRHRRLIGTKVHCLVRDARACEQLAQGCYMNAERPEIEPATFGSQSQVQRPYTTTAPASCQLTARSIRRGVINDFITPCRISQPPSQ